MTRHAILLVDDEKHVLSALERALRKEPYTLLTAGSAEMGLSLLAAREVSVVISDYNMPGMHGLAFLKQAKVEYPHILGIMLTGQAELDIAVRAINEAGIYKFIQKPWNDEDLKLTLRRTLEWLDLASEKDRLQQKVRSRETILSELEKQHPGITKVQRDADGCLRFDD